VNAADRRDGQQPPPDDDAPGLITSFGLESLYRVVATELATNVVRHGGGTGKLRLWRSGDVIVCEVSDDGPGIAMPHQVGTKPVPLSTDGGRGLWLVRHFTDSVEIINRDPGTTVTVSMAINAIG
jgi:anti-sigma regulatory factor (Ser/Thr protein kinase)